MTDYRDNKTMEKEREITKEDQEARLEAIRQKKTELELLRRKARRKDLLRPYHDDLE